MTRKRRVIAAVVIALVGVVFATACRYHDLVSEWPFVTLVSVAFFITLLVLAWDRLREVDLRNLRMKLAAAQQEAQEKAAELRDLKFMFRMDSSKMEALGLKPGTLVMASAVMRYCAGCIKRERERLGRAFAETDALENVAKAVVSEEHDDLVFKWAGPETSLDVPPKSLQERQRQKGEGS